MSVTEIEMGADGTEASEENSSTDKAREADGQAAPETLSTPAQITEAKATDGPSSTVMPEYDGTPRITESLQAQMEALQRGFEAKIKYDASKEKIIDNLHRELQNAREDLHFKILRPVFVDLIAMYDDMCKLIAHASRATDTDTGQNRLFIDSIDSFLEAIEEILARNGVTAFSMDGDQLVQQRQRVVETIPTGEVGLDSHIAERRRKGFAYEDKILRPELVATYRYKDAPDS